LRYDGHEEEEEDRVATLQYFTVSQRILIKNVTLSEFRGTPNLNSTNLTTIEVIYKIYTFTILT